MFRKIDIIEFFIEDQNKNKTKKTTTTNNKKDQTKTTK